MSQYVIIYDPNAEDIDRILDLFADFNVTKIEYTLETKYQFNNDEIVLLYLDRNQIAHIVPIADQNSWNIGLLPHPKAGNILNDLGISNKIEEAIEDIFKKQFKKYDLLLCNNYPVFKSISIGDMFVFNQTNQSSWHSKTFSFIKSAIELSQKRHTPYKIDLNDKTIDTCAFGMTIVDHSINSIVTKRLVGESYSNDAMFYLTVLYPRSISEILTFLTLSIFSNKNFATCPKFIGLIKTDYAKISNKSGVKFKIDGNELSAKEILITVKQEALNIIQGREADINEVKIGANKKFTQLIKHLPLGEVKDQLITRQMPFFTRATTEEFKELFLVIKDNSKLNQPYLVMLILSTLVAVLGLFSNSSPVIIGAMILAPLMSPIISSAMGIVRNDMKLLKASTITLIIGTLVALLFATILTYIIPLKLVTNEISARLTPNLLDLGVAIGAGVAGAYATAKAEVAKSIAGVAIAVALVPPLATAGIGIGWLNVNMFYGAFLLYLTNLAGIILSAGLSFIVLGFAPVKKAQKGILYTALSVILLSIPLTYSFNRTIYEANLSRSIESIKIDNLIVENVKVARNSEVEIEVELSSANIITEEMKQFVLKRIDQIVDKPFTIRIKTSLLLKSADK